jgi:nucleoside-diphosphate-sugar epimerase
MIWTVFGSKGVIGSYLVSHLNSLGHTVITPPRDLNGLFRGYLGHVIYAVGLTADFRQRPYETVEAHINLVSQILQKAEFDSFLYLSSTRVYSRSNSGCEDSLLTVSPMDPSDLYNISKLMGESICLQDVRNNIRVVRLSNVVGGDDINTCNFIPSLIKESRCGRIYLKTDLNSSKDYVHIDDIADLITIIAVQGSKRIYNLASGSSIKHSDWVSQIALHTGCIIEVALHAPVINFVPIDITRVKSEFNFKPRSVTDVLTKYF